MRSARDAPALAKYNSSLNESTAASYTFQSNPPSSTSNTRLRGSRPAAPATGVSFIPAFNSHLPLAIGTRPATAGAVSSSRRPPQPLNSRPSSSSNTRRPTPSANQRLLLSTTNPRAPASPGTPKSTATAATTAAPHYLFLGTAPSHHHYGAHQSTKSHRSTHQNPSLRINGLTNLPPPTTHTHTFLKNIITPTTLAAPVLRGSAQQPLSSPYDATAASSTAASSTAASSTAASSTAASSTAASSTAASHLNANPSDSAPSTHSGIYTWGLNNLSQTSLPPTSPDPLPLARSSRLLLDEPTTLLACHLTDDTTLLHTTTGELLFAGYIPPETPANASRDGPAVPIPGLHSIPMPPGVRPNAVSLGPAGRLALTSTAGLAYVYHIPPTTSNPPRARLRPLLSPTDEPITAVHYASTTLTLLLADHTVHRTFHTPPPSPSQQPPLPLYIRLSSPHPISVLSCGHAHTLALTPTGIPLSHGSPHHGVLGTGVDGPGTPRFAPIEYDVGQAPVTAVHAGHDNSLMTTADGRIFTFGSATTSLLGFPSYGDVYTPTMVPGFGGNTVIKTACLGARGVLVVSDAGNCYGWGLLPMGGKSGSCGTSVRPVLLEYFAQRGLRVGGVGVSKCTAEELPPPNESTFHSVVATTEWWGHTLEEFDGSVDGDLCPEMCVAVGEGVFTHVSKVGGCWNVFTVAGRNERDEDLVTGQPVDNSYVNELVVNVRGGGGVPGMREREFKERVMGASGSVRPNAVTWKGVNNKDGTWAVEYLCGSGGEYELEVGFKKVREGRVVEQARWIKESPFRVTVTPGVVDPQYCRVHGPVVVANEAQVGGVTRVLVQLFDGPNMPLRGGGHNVKVSMAVVSGDGKKRVGKVEFDVVDHGDGFYTASKCLTRSGEYHLWVRVGGWDVGGGGSVFVTEGGEEGQTGGHQAREQVLQQLTPIAGFPRRIYVNEGLPAARTSSVDLSHFQQSCDVNAASDLRSSAGAACRFSLHIRDMFGNYTACQQHEIEVFVGYENEDVPFSVQEKKAGVYDVEFKPRKAGRVTVFCFVLGIPATKANAETNTSGEEFDPYQHQYDDNNKPVAAISRVQISGCPFAITVQEIPIDKRLDPSASKVSLLSNRHDVFKVDGPLSSFCWTRASTIGGGGIAFVKVMLRDKSNGQISFDNLPQDALAGIVKELQKSVKVELVKVEQVQIKPVFKLDGSSPPYFQLSGIPEMVDASGQHKAALALRGPPAAEGKREAFARKFAAAQEQKVYAPVSQSPQSIAADFELELTAESFKMLSMIGDEGERAGGDEGALDSVLIKVCMPLVDDLYSMNVSFGDVPFGGGSLFVSIVPQVTANFCMRDEKGERAVSIEGDARVNDGFLFVSGVECSFGPPAHASASSGRRGGGGGKTHLRLQMLPRHVLAERRVYCEIKQTGGEDPVPLAVTLDARSDPLLSQLAANAINLLGLYGEGGLVGKMRVLLMVVENFTGGGVHGDARGGGVGGRNELRRFWESVGEAQKEISSLVLGAGEVARLYVRSGVCGVGGEGGSKGLLVLRAVLFKYICDRSGVGGCSVVGGGEGGCFCEVQGGEKGGKIVVDLRESSVVEKVTVVESPKGNERGTGKRDGVEGGMQWGGEGQGGGRGMREFGFEGIGDANEAEMMERASLSGVMFTGDEVCGLLAKKKERDKEMDREREKERERGAEWGRESERLEREEKEERDERSVSVLGGGSSASGSRANTGAVSPNLSVLLSLDVKEERNDDDDFGGW